MKSENDAIIEILERLESAGGKRVQFEFHTLEEAKGLPLLERRVALLKDIGYIEDYKKDQRIANATQQPFMRIVVTGLTSLGSEELDRARQKRGSE